MSTGSPFPSVAEQAAIPSMLRLLRDRLGLEAGFVCELTADREVVLALESHTAMPLGVGDWVARRSSLAHRVSTGELPGLCTDAVAVGAAEMSGVALGGVRAWAATTRSVCGHTLILGAFARRIASLPADAAALLGQVAAELTAPLEAAMAGLDARTRVQEVIDAGGPAIVAQPVLDLDSSTSIGVEALARFPDGRGPGEWFAEAESCGLGVALELSAARRAARLLDLTGGTVGINLSVAALADPEVLRFLSALPVSRVVVELTEHEPVGDYGALAAGLAPLRRRGMSLAVDDAGAGFASLRHVLRLAPDWIKIDQTIVAGADQDPARRALLEALVVFARGAGMRLVAEGVETAGEAELVGRLGVHCAQGWHYGRPRQLAEIPQQPQRQQVRGGGFGGERPAQQQQQQRQPAKGSASVTVLPVPRREVAGRTLAG